MELPLNLSIRGVQKNVIVPTQNSTRDAYDKINQFSPKKRKWLCLVPTGQTGLTDRLDRSSQTASQKQYIKQFASHYHNIT